MSEATWEDVCSPHAGDYLERIKVPGGWIYRTYLCGEEESVSVAMVFVPKLLVPE